MGRIGRRTPRRRRKAVCGLHRRVMLRRRNATRRPTDGTERPTNVTSSPRSATKRRGGSSIWRWNVIVKPNGVTVPPKPETKPPTSHVNHSVSAPPRPGTDMRAQGTGSRQGSNGTSALVTAPICTRWWPATWRTGRRQPGNGRTPPSIGCKPPRIDRMPTLTARASTPTLQQIRSRTARRKGNADLIRRPTSKQTLPTIDDLHTASHEAVGDAAHHQGHPVMQMVSR